ncbi:unnamed protein product [Rotaria sordida]|uniref:Tyrosine-protein kinase ephrin type A/B receptor-like domain-containing protein n=1 Tax=Rotaria sordida TaxID=392033 RepID=A0A819DYZ4_9BILA|nr:unnamed protein product [Rotaria sordida]
MLRIALLSLILFVTLSSISTSIIRKTRLRRQFDPEYCHAIEGFECKCSYYRVICTIDDELPSPINILDDEKQKYKSVELSIRVVHDIIVNDHTFEPIKELYKLDGDHLEFRIKFEKFTALNLSSSGIFNRVFPDNLSQNARKNLTLEIYNPLVSPSDDSNLFQNLNADQLEVYALYPFHGTFQQLFNGSNIKYLRMSGGDIRSDASQSFTGNIGRLELAKLASALSVQNFPVYPAHEFIINAFYVVDFNHEHPPNYVNLAEIRVYSSYRIPANAFRRFPNIHTLSVETDRDIDLHAFDGLTNLEKLTIKSEKLNLDIFNSLPNLKEFETNVEELDEKTQCKLVEKLADGQVAVQAISNSYGCTCILAYLDTAAGRIPCDAQHCENSSCDTIKNNYNANTSTFNVPPPIQRSDGTDALREHKPRVYTVPFQVPSQDQEKFQQGTSQQLLEADPQRPNADEQNLWESDESYNPENLDSWFEQDSCSAGKYLYEGQCILCTPGYYCPDECLEGWYSTRDTQETCLMCPKGFYCPISNQEPQACPVGYYSHYAATECTKCPPGYYTTYTNSSYCFQCPMGYSCTDPTQCPQPCPAGTYQPHIMSTSCEPCPDEHQCGTTTNLIQCTATSCIQAEAWSCDQSRLGPPASVCTNMG